MFEAEGVVRVFFFFNDTRTPKIDTLPLHGAVPICFFDRIQRFEARQHAEHAVESASAWLTVHVAAGHDGQPHGQSDRKSTRLNSSHANISYAVFCLKKRIYVPNRHLEANVDAP